MLSAAFELAVLSDAGRQRGLPNEDAGYAAAVGEKGGVLLAVADGVGGQPGGAQASKAAVDALRSMASAGDGVAVLEQAVRAAHAAVRRVAVSDPRFASASTTLTVAYLRGGEGWVANVGDSRAYRVHGDSLQLITRDHSTAQALVDRGQLSPAEALTHPLRHEVTRWLGRELAEPDLVRVELSADDVLLLCTDGLWGAVPEFALQRLVTRARGRRLELLARALVRAANAAGGPDNITVALARPVRPKP